jgi:GntR family transcriptional regulator
MDGELWRRLYQLIEDLATRHEQNPTMTYPDATIVAAYAWSVLHDRPVCWACDAANWGRAPEALRPAPLPSQPTMSRRPRHDQGVRQFLEELEQALSASLCLCRLCLCRLCLCRLWLYRLLDAKPLPVGRYSKDPDAAVGHGAGGIDKGYTAHTLWHTGPVPLWELRPMNVAEQTVALRLVTRVAGDGEGGYVLADKGYDSGRVHDRCAARGPAAAGAAAAAQGRRPRPRAAEPAPAARTGNAAPPDGPGPAAAAVPGRAAVRPPVQLRRRAVPAAGVGPATAPRAAVGAGEADHQRRAHPTRAGAHGGMSNVVLAKDPTEIAGPARACQILRRVRLRMTLRRWTRPFSDCLSAFIAARPFSFCTSPTSTVGSPLRERMPFELSISTGSTVPIYRQIVDQICRAIATGALAPGEQLPSVRALAERLVVNPNTVARTYGDLIREGVLESQQGRGVFVPRRPRRAVYTRGERLRRIGPTLDAFVSQGVYLGFTSDELREALESRLRQLDRPRTTHETRSTNNEVPR